MHSMDATRALLRDAADRAATYLETISRRPVAPRATDVADLGRLAGPLQDDPVDPADVLALLDSAGSPATMASAGGRYFGFVVGGALPATLGASVLATAWDQNTGMEIGSAVGARLEQICRGWLVDLLGLPSSTEVGFVTGATMANLTGLAAARHALLAKAGWDVEGRGLFGAPGITVVVGEHVHVSVLKALSLLGLGRERVIRVPVDDQGRLIATALPASSGPTIVCLQAGNVNSGAFDPIAQVAEGIAGTGTWLHVDGAFGLWAAASPTLRPLIAGLDQADSVATDAHKWLNVPYDSGLVFVRERRHLNAAMAASAAYLVEGESRDPHLFVRVVSRRARAIEVWAALKSLGRRGIADLMERNCRQARRFAEGLRAAGWSILNDVVLNQVLASFGTDEQTRRVIQAIQADGTCWCGGTVWHGRSAMRISVSSWATTDEDVDASLAVMLRLAGVRA
jgi:glutamate/tyrosine decarboxylase-like PLP-dependent enzyme